MPKPTPEDPQLQERVIDIRDLTGHESDVRTHELPRMQVELPDARQTVTVQIAPVTYDLTPTRGIGAEKYLARGNGSRLMLAAQVVGRKETQTLWTVPGPARFTVQQGEDSTGL